MTGLIDVLCSTQGWSKPEGSSDEYSFNLDGRPVIVTLIEQEGRVFVHSEVAVGRMDLAAYVKLGRFGFSWAVGSGLSIGLHPTSDDIALVGCGLEGLGSLASDAGKLHFVMRRAAIAAKTLEDNFASRSMPNNGIARSSAIRGCVTRQAATTQIL